ncbi:ABC transporter ATP-binding protein [Aureimonas flava]|uniref:ABC transporter ATP-binding protein n=1 Tax=Aureimonas flava TaxID=2320271 RepID=A0A3A1WQ87_9HYPH|nr:ABC transporter ATP-binding protein [Aureimonas flava]RIY03253.1 ABC transporter ATP-binding protein [Aureimonas flava]
MTSQPIAIQGIRKSYGRNVALDDVSLAIRAGEFLTLLGPSGSGKTTLLMAIAGFVRPDAGSIRVGEREIAHLPPNRRDIGFVFQNYALFPHMSVLANVEYPLKLRKVPRREASERARIALARVRLEGFEGRDIAALSGGQRQRVALARAMVFEPRIMLMDEPLSALDKNLREQMQFEIRRIHDEVGITTVYVTHDQREALTMSDRIAVMESGSIRQVETPRLLYDRPQTDFVATFLGEANILQRCSFDAADIGAMPDGETLMVRAENLRLSADAVAPGALRLHGSLAAKAFRGENWMLQVAMKEQRLLTLSIPAFEGRTCEELAPGDPITAYVNRSDVHPLNRRAGA